MIRLTSFVLVMMTVICGCSDRTTNQNGNANFKTFEISYTNGATTSFTFSVDTNKIYFLTGRADTTYYGLLPEEIVNLIDTTALQITHNTNIKSNDLDCYDCSMVATKIVTGKDTIRINQAGQIDSLFFPVIETLQNFISNGHHQKIQAILLLETESVIIPSPNSIKEVEFTAPE